MGYGGIIASALAGAVSGGGQAAVDDITMRQKDEMERIRQERLASLQLGNQKAMLDYTVKSTNDNAATATANEVARQNALTPGIVDRATRERRGAADVDAMKPQKMSAGESIYDPKTKTTEFTAPIKDITPEDKKYKEAQAKELDAHADFYKAQAEDLRANGKGKGAEAKPDLPKIIKSKDADGNEVLIDERSGAIGKVVPGTPAEPPGETGMLWWKKEKPGKPGTNTSIQWTEPDGTPIEGGIESKYPDMMKRSAKANAVSGKNEDTGGGNRPVSTSAGSFAGATASKPNVYVNGKNPNDAERLGILQRELADATTQQNRDAINSEIKMLSKKMGVPTDWVPIGHAQDGRTVYRTPDGKQKVL